MFFFLEKKRKDIELVLNRIEFKFFGYAILLLANKMPALKKTLKSPMSIPKELLL